MNSYQVDSEVPALVTLIRSGSVTSSALSEAGNTMLRARHNKVAYRTLILALLASLVFRALLTYLFVYSIAGAFLASRVTLFADCFTSQRSQSSMFLGAYPFIIVTCNKINLSISRILMSRNKAISEGGGRNSQRFNVERPIFRNLGIADEGQNFKQ